MSHRYRYIRYRTDTNKWQCRIYSDSIKFSFTDDNLEKVITRRNQVLGFDPDNEPKEATYPTIIIIDIENSPLLAHTWGLYNQNIAPSQIERDWFIMCFAYKTLNSDIVQVISQAQFRNYQSGTDCEKEVVKELWQILDNADIAVAHNAVRFDIPKINTKFLQYNFPPPSPYKVIDTLKIAKQNFKFTSNKLDYIAKFIDSEGKKSHSGMQMWLDCIAGNQTAWREMEEYNARDIDELEKVYLAVRAWDKHHPNLAHYDLSPESMCTVCQSINLKEDGKAYTGVSAFIAIRCQDCGHIMRTRKSIHSKSKKKELLTNVS